MLLCANSPLIIPDGVIQNSEKVDESIIEYARQSGKLVLDCKTRKTMQMPATSSTMVWDATANEEE